MGDKGATMISETLKCNSTLTALTLDRFYKRTVMASKMRKQNCFFLWEQITQSEKKVSLLFVSL